MLQIHYEFFSLELNNLTLQWCPLQMEALMLFSQEQERYLLEKQRDLIVIEELQKNLSQVLPLHFLLLITFQSQRTYLNDMTSVLNSASILQSHLALS